MLKLYVQGPLLLKNPKRAPPYTSQCSMQHDSIWIRIKIGIIDDSINTNGVGIGDLDHRVFSKTTKHVLYGLKHS